MTEAIEIKIKYWLNAKVTPVEVASIPENEIEEQNNLIKMAIHEFPKLTGMTKQDIAIKILNKCFRKRADKYKYRELLVIYGYYSKLKF